MNFLNPLFLAAAAAVAVPVLIHLLHLRSGRRRAFPALRYLRRTEREHARRIRLRQILLLILRMAAIVLLVAAGARLFLQGRGGDHEPTALAIVLDNSISSGVVLDDERMLDVLKRTALSSLETATPEDRIWIVRAGEPWRTPVPGTPAEARRRIQETEVRGTTASLPRTVARARSLVASAGMPASEVHLLSDLQATGFADAGGEPGSTDVEVPVLVLAPPGRPPPNRHVSLVEVGGGLPPLLNQSTQISARVDTDAADEADDTVRLRLVVDGRTTGAADAPLGSTVLMRAGPFALTEVSGSVEIDPDALRGDDRRYFAFQVRPPPRVSPTEETGVFLAEALSVLADAERVRRVEASEADVLIAGGGAALENDDSGTPAIVLPPEDPALLPAANRRLREAGVPWRLEADLDIGETSLQPVDLPVTLAEIRIQRAYRLLPVDGEGEDEGSIRVRRSSGEPWMVSTESEEGRPVLILGSPLVPEATTLPVSPDMLPLVEWMVSGWPPTFRTASASETGEPLTLPAGVTRVRTPDGTLHRVDGRQPFQATGSPGLYEVLDGDSVVTRMAVNPPVSESLLERLEPEDVLRRLAPPARTVDGPEAWTSRIFLQRRGREPWRLLLLATLLVLVGEGLLAAGGSGRSTAERERPKGVEKKPGSEGANVS